MKKRSAPKHLPISLTVVQPAAVTGGGGKALMIDFEWEAESIEFSKTSGKITST